MKTTIFGLIAVVASAIAVSDISAMPVTVSGQAVAQPGDRGNATVTINSVPQAASDFGTLSVSVSGPPNGQDDFFQPQFFFAGGSPDSAIQVNLTPTASLSLDGSAAAVFSIVSGLISATSDGVLQIFFDDGQVSDGSIYTASFSYNAVPEPTTMTLLGIGALVGTGAIRRRKRTASPAMAV